MAFAKYGTLYSSYLILMIILGKFIILPTSGWSWDAADRPTFAILCDQLESMLASADIDEAVAFELERDRMRLPPPPRPPPRRRSTSCDQLEDILPPSIPFGEQKSPTNALGSHGDHPFQGVTYFGGNMDSVQILESSPFSCDSLGRKRAPRPPTRTTTLRRDIECISETSPELTISVHRPLGDRALAAASPSSTLPSPPSVSPSGFIKLARNVHTPTSQTFTAPSQGDHKFHPSKDIHSWQKTKILPMPSAMTSSAIFPAAQTDATPRRQVLPVICQNGNPTTPTADPSAFRLCPALPMKASATGQLTPSSPGLQKGAWEPSYSIANGSCLTHVFHSILSSCKSFPTPPSEKAAADSPLAGRMPPSSSEFRTELNRRLRIHRENVAGQEVSHCAGHEKTEPPNGRKESVTERQSTTGCLLLARLKSTTSSSVCRSNSSADSIVSSLSKATSPLITQLSEFSKQTLKSPGTVSVNNISSSTHSLSTTLKLAKSAQNKVSQGASQGQSSSDHFPINSSKKRNSWTPSLQQLTACSYHKNVSDVLSKDEKSIPTGLQEEVYLEDLENQIQTLHSMLDLAVQRPSSLLQMSALGDRIEEICLNCMSFVDENSCSAHSKFRFRDFCTRLSSTKDVIRSLNRLSLTEDIEEGRLSPDLIKALETASCLLDKMLQCLKSVTPNANT